MELPSGSAPPSPFKIADLITIEDAAANIGAKPGAVRRWAREGLKVPKGPTIKLAHVYIGGRLKTQAIWVEEFVAAITRARSATDVPLTVEQSARRARELAAVDRDLDEALGPRDTVPLRPTKAKPVALPAATPATDPPRRRGRRPKNGKEA
jgi:hypothetical protein